MPQCFVYTEPGTTAHPMTHPTMVFAAKENEQREDERKTMRGNKATRVFAAKDVVTVPTLIPEVRMETDMPIGITVYL